MSLMNEISTMIEEEVERRVNARLQAVIEHIANRWDISILQLTKDISKFADAKCEQCLGYNKKTKKRCRNKAKNDGFCHAHKSQMPKPVPRIIQEEQHTHSMPPLYIKGCPVCDKAKNPFVINEQVRSSSGVSEDILFD